MTEHTPTPWNCATAYSSLMGVPIIASSGRRIGNTAGIEWPEQWAEMKQDAVANAAFIVKAVNNHDALVKALEDILRCGNAIVTALPAADDPQAQEAFDMYDGARRNARTVLAVVGTVGGRS